MRARISYGMFFLVILGVVAICSGTSQATRSNPVINPKAAVLNAVAQGPSAVETLGREAKPDSALADAILDQAKTDPMVAAVVLNDISTTKTATSEPKARRKYGNSKMRKAPPGSACYGKSNSWVTRSALGKVLTKIKVVQDGFCVNHRSEKITKDFGWHGYPETWGPYCIADFTFEHGWASYPKRKYGEVGGSFGVNLPTGCAGVVRDKAKLVITWYGGQISSQNFGNG